MKRKKLERIIDANLGGMREALGLWDWKIRVYYGTVPSGGSRVAGEVFCNARYNTAEIHFDPSKIEKLPKLRPGTGHHVDSRERAVAHAA